MILTWTPYVVRGKTYWQLNAPGFRSPLRTGACAEGIGHVGWREARTWRAEAQIDWEHTAFFNAGSFHAARRVLERDLCRKSLGWFGVDDLEFVLPNG